MSFVLVCEQKFVTTWLRVMSHVFNHDKHMYTSKTSMQYDEGEEVKGEEVMQLRRSIRQGKLIGPIKPPSPSVLTTQMSLTPELLVGTIEVPKIVPVEKFNKQSEKEKMGQLYSVLNKVCDKLAEINTTLHNETAGVCAWITTCQTQADNNTTSIHAASKLKSEEDKTRTTTEKLIEDDIAAIKSENTVLKGLVQKQHTQIAMLNDKVAYLTMKSMENNVTISGLEGDTGKKENCIQNVINFLVEKVKIEASKDEILTAHRSGIPRGDKPRIMIVHCIIPLRDRILKNSKNLKDILNIHGDKYLINKQLPDSYVEQNRQIREKIHKVKEAEKELPNKLKSKIEVTKGEVLVNGDNSPMSHLHQVEPMDLFPEEHEKAKWSKLKLVTSDVKSEENSDFMAFAVKTSQFIDVTRAYRKVKSLYPAVNHIVAVYKLKNGYDGYQDDNEHGAGHRLANMLIEDKSISNVAVFVCRKYGGTHLGFCRF